MVWSVPHLKYIHDPHGQLLHRPMAHNTSMGYSQHSTITLLLVSHIYGVYSYVHNSITFQRITYHKYIYFNNQCDSLLKIISLHIIYNPLSIFLSLYSFHISNDAKCQCHDHCDHLTTPLNKFTFTFMK